jgi:hypothetical protein
VGIGVNVGEGVGVVVGVKVGVTVGVTEDVGVGVGSAQSPNEGASLTCIYDGLTLEYVETPSSGAYCIVPLHIHKNVFVWFGPKLSVATFPSQSMAFINTNNGPVFEIIYEVQTQGQSG